MAKTKYNLHLKGYVGGWDFDSDYVDFVLNKNTDKEVADHLYVTAYPYLSYSQENLAYQ